MIPAAGLGTRFLPATKAQPKEMLPIVDKPAIQYIVEEAVASGIDDIVIITGRTKRAIEDHFDKSVELNLLLESKKNHSMLETLDQIENMADIYYVRQKEPLGLGHAILCAKKHIDDEPFAVFLGDDLILSEKPCIQNLIELYERYHSCVLSVYAVPQEKIPLYGIIKYKKNNGDLLVEDLVEKPSIKDAPSNLAIVGRYILKPEIFGILESTPFGAGNELQLTDALRKLNKKERMVAYNITDGQWLTVGDKITYLKATVEFALQRPDLKEEFLNYLKEVVERK